jgi:probable HAF family extracellular repeat protein
MTDLGTLGGKFSSGLGINASGDVVGWSTVAGDSVFHAFLYSGGTMKDLGAFLSADAINDLGEITGTASGQQVFLYSDGTLKYLEIGGGANAINDFGQITGYIYPANHAFLYNDGTTTDLGEGVGWSINNFSQVVGSSHAGAPSSPFLYSPGTGRVQVSSLLPLVCEGGTCVSWDNLLNIITGINDAGQITGQGMAPFTGNLFPVLFSPVTSSFSAFEAKLQFIGKGETHFRLRGSFTLGADSDGLNPLTQQLLLQLGSLPIPIQKGSFSQDSKGNYVFQGVVGSAAIDFRIKPVTSTTFKFEVEGLIGTPFPLTNPARFILMIGNNKTMGTLPWR